MPAKTPGLGLLAAAGVAGYKRAGSAAQGISIAIPASWVTINPAQKAMESALQKLGIPGTTGQRVAAGDRAVR